MSLYRKVDKIIEVSTLPNRKRPMLFVGKGNSVNRVGVFSSDKDAKTFQEYLDYFLGITPEVKEANDH